MSWKKLMEIIEIEGSKEEIDIMKPKELSISELSKLLGVTPIRIYQLQKRKKNPLPMIKSDEKSGRNVWSIKEIPLLEWIEQEEEKIDSRKKVDYSNLHAFSSILIALFFFLYLRKTIIDTANECMSSGYFLLF